MDSFIFQTRLIILALLAIPTYVTFGKLIPDALKDSSYRINVSQGIKYLLVSIYTIIYVFIACLSIYLLINPKDFIAFTQSLLN